MADTRTQETSGRQAVTRRYESLMSHSRYADDAEMVRDYIDSDSSWAPQVLVDAGRALEAALEDAVKEYSRLGLAPAEISETIAELVFQAWVHLPDDEDAA